ncbi:pyrroloquinoline quinone biosynthesis peptide chaperone PqqD [Lentzea tibetensis]|uniref:Pyrroloquinoline quinone biosynthesis peptide chaperone PqqD n=1 Tax=Lentzea tibetensis TaxID=2591470 RepID=A0A563EN65_9PSEU|nr:pyrroloquinoline quinone biosynthesis peptide chaperone PqqD [Lentzea tibetensis]TWP48651.1 pyrroloquinoline quinone biosynthesis peptide chaperone PqqD [Lentzea tibetensis]
MTSLEAVPRIRRGVKCTYDQIRGSHVVLFPEGVLVLNETAAMVVERCDGNTTVGDIALRLAEEFDGVEPQDIAELVSRLVARRVVDIDVTDG